MFCLRDMALFARHNDWNMALRITPMILDTTADYIVYELLARNDDYQK